MATTSSSRLSVKISRGTQLREHHLADHLRAHPVTAKSEDPISLDVAIFEYRAQTTVKVKNANTQTGKKGPCGKRTKPGSLKTLEPSNGCLKALKRKMVEDATTRRVLPKIRKVEELHDLTFEEYADNFFQELEQSANDSEFFIRIGQKIYIKSLLPSILHSDNLE